MMLHGLSDRVRYCSAATRRAARRSHKLLCQNVAERAARSRASSRRLTGGLVEAHARIRRRSRDARSYAAWWAMWCSESRAAAGETAPLINTRRLTGA